MAAREEVPKDGILLTLSVPPEAQVTINGKVTSSLGATRVFTSKGLKAGKKYDFTVTMKTQRDGQPISDEKKVSLAVGERQHLVMVGQPPSLTPAAAPAAAPAGAPAVTPPAAPAVAGASASLYRSPGMQGD